MDNRYALVITGENDPMWPFLQEACSEGEKRRLVHLITDRPDLCNCTYDPVEGTAELNIRGRKFRGDDFCGVWLRRFVPPQLGHFSHELRDYCEREYQDFMSGLECALPEAHWISLPSAIDSARSKSRQLRLASKIGFDVPSTLFSNSVSQVDACMSDGGWIYKSIRSPRVPLLEDHHTTVFTTVLDGKTKIDSQGIESCPGILQKFVKKSADIRVTVFGKDAFPVLIDSQSNERSKVDFRFGARKLIHLRHELPVDVLSQCVTLVQQLGLQYGAVDLALMADGSYRFFEINPNGQWGWLEQKVGFPMRRALLDMLFAG